VFIVAAQKLDLIQPSSERSFLYKTALYAASKYRRSEQRRREDLVGDIEMAAEPDLDELLDRRRAREMLDRIVATMPMALRVVFVLYEIDGIPTAEIAEILRLPPGTVASRLRRAREDFEARVARLEARRSAKGGGR
jgi:RNA polymerase sigma-70 factor (ECF subfamily)